jgi:methylmalonyl-CoA/ethylmalonyl-CoA epimerase
MDPSPGVDRAVLPPGARFDHVAHAARKIADLLPLYRDTLGGRFTTGADSAELGFRTVHITYRDGSKIELLEPLSGSKFLDGFFARHPNGGLHHVTFRVDDLDLAIAAATAAGLEVFGLSRVKPKWHEFFMHPRVAGGVLVQIAQAADDFPPPTCGSIEEFLAS